MLATNTEGFGSAAISGDGRVVWAVTQLNRLLRIDVGSSSADEVLPPLGGVRSVVGIGVPGSALQLQGQGFTRDQQAFDGTTILPLADATPSSYWLEIPWEYAGDSRRTILLRSPKNPFETTADISILSGVVPQFARVADKNVGPNVVKAVHQDFSTLVDSSNPARPGETIHVYMTGLGALDRPVATGVPAPFSPLARPLATVGCELLQHPGALTVPLVAYAGGLIGVYQVDVTMPDVLGDQAATLRCTANGTGDVGNLPTTSAR
jgi:uncharacterized protein (TIGR03437 family)